MVEFNVVNIDPISNSVKAREIENAAKAAFFISEKLNRNLLSAAFLFRRQL